MHAHNPLLIISWYINLVVYAGGFTEQLLAG